MNDQIYPVLMPAGQDDYSKPLQLLAKEIRFIDPIDATIMQSYPHRGGFSVDTSVRIGQHDMQGLERLFRYCARPPFAG